MGYSASAITVIGYRVPREQGIFKHSTPGCKCAIPEELRQSYKFCPSCGKPATVVVSERLEERWPHRDTPVNSNSSEGGDFYVGQRQAFVLLRHFGSGDEITYLGCGAQKLPYRRHLSVFRQGEPKRVCGSRVTSGLELAQ